MRITDKENTLLVAVVGFLGLVVIPVLFESIFIYPACIQGALAPVFCGFNWPPILSLGLCLLLIYTFRKGKSRKASEKSEPLNVPSNNGVYRKEGDKIIFGESRSVVIHNGGYYLSSIEIYQDGLIDCWKLMDIEEFKVKVRSGWVATEIPEGVTISGHLLNSFKANNPSNYLEPEELIKEVIDTIAKLQGLPTSSQICREAFEEFQIKPTISNKEKLRLAYEAIPVHMRGFVLGDMDRKDRPITDIIYG